MYFLCEMLVPHLLCGPLQMKGSPPLAYGMPFALLVKLQRKTARVWILALACKSCVMEGRPLDSFVPSCLYLQRESHSTYFLGFHWGLNYWSVWRAKSSAWNTVSLSERQEHCNLLVHISAVLLPYHHHHVVLWLSLNTCIFTLQSIFSLNMRAVDYSFFPFLVSDLGFPDGISGKNSPANAWDTRDVGLIPGSGYSPGGGNDNPL